jgi:uncharacterized membrane protein
MRRSRAWIWTLAVAVYLLYQWLVHFYFAVSDGASEPALLFVAGAPHAAINLLLLWVFGRTLAPGREPLVTTFARKADSRLPAFMEAYARRVTIAWCLFCALQLIASAALFAWGSLEHWSLFVTVLSLVLVGAMFVAEYAYRILRYPNYPHVSIWTGIRMFRERHSAPKPEAPPSLPNIPFNG